MCGRVLHTTLHCTSNMYGSSLYSSYSCVFTRRRYCFHMLEATVAPRPHQAHHQPPHSSPRPSRVASHSRAPMPSPGKFPYCVRISGCRRRTLFGERFRSTISSVRAAEQSLPISPFLRLVQLHILDSCALLLYCCIVYHLCWMDIVSTRS